MMVIFRYAYGMVWLWFGYSVYVCFLWYSNILLFFWLPWVWFG